MYNIASFDFKSGVVKELYKHQLANEKWPLVYILLCPQTKQMYIGETNDVITRFKSHLTDPDKKKLTSAYLITSKSFDKSITQDLESKLIKHLAAVGEFKVLNDNLGSAGKNFPNRFAFEKEKFPLIWEKLRQAHIISIKLEKVNNSPLFKYSPYNDLTKDQYLSLAAILKNLVTPGKPTNLVIGGSGTGKTILAIFLMKLLCTPAEDINTTELFKHAPELHETIQKIKSKYPNPSIALVIPQSSFRKTIQKVFSHIYGLKSKMVIGPADLSRNKYDIVLVDESHRLRKRINLGSYFNAFDAACARLNMNKFKATELKWALKQSRHQVLFYDSRQTIRRSDVDTSDYSDLKLKPTTTTLDLTSQIRIKGGNKYSSFVENLFFKPGLHHDKLYTSNKYDFFLFDSVRQMRLKILEREKEISLSRVVAGYSWEWISKNHPERYDIVIGKSRLRWNSTTEDWINSPNAIKEVGCIHTVQGYDLNYAGIIFGHEIGFDPKRQKIITRKDNYMDITGKAATSDEQLHDYILNIYTTLLHRGISGSYVYVCDPELRQYFARRIPLYNPLKSS